MVKGICIMRLLNSNIICLPNMWEPQCNGLFIPQGQGCAYVFQNNLRVCFCFLSADCKINMKTSSPLCGLPLPEKWQLLESYLVVGKDQALYLDELTWVNTVPAAIQEAYTAAYIPDSHYVESMFSFGDHTISHKGACGYICHRKGIPIWTFQGKAYLYTDIFRWQDHIYFSTAGRGGEFYILDLHTGQLLLKIDTGGTRCLARRGSLCYILCHSPKECSGKVLCIDVEHCKIVAEQQLDGCVTSNSKLQLIDKTLHAITFQYAHSKLEKIFWHQIAVE